MTTVHCSTTEDGSTFCTVSDDTTDAVCGCSPTSQKIAISDIQEVAPMTSEKTGISPRSILMFGIACLTSPCCTPLYVPLLLALTAGTPLAAILTQYVGWIYGGLTIVSIVSIVLAMRWMKFKRQRAEQKPKRSQPSFAPTQQISPTVFKGETR